MGLKDDLIKAKVECFKIMGKSEDEIDSSVGSALEVEANLMTEAIVNFLTNVEFKITQLKANVVLEDFSIPPQQGDILPSVTSTDIPYPAGIPVAAVPIPLNNGTNGVRTKAIDISKDTGNLESTGYVFIGEDPDSQDDFDVEDENGQREFTTVKLFRDDIEEFL
tara:strand:- start:5227 stop:5721 length:495 start_codon:yes stop_codon:yes gene_type:complete